MQLVDSNNRNLELKSIFHLSPFVCNQVFRRANTYALMFVLYKC
jgi:hypothetical protein